MKGDQEIAGLPPQHPGLARLETILRICEQGDKRADQKLAGATLEKARSAAAVEAARAQRDAWIVDNAEPQMTML